jgi:hypothetical protein
MNAVAIIMEWKFAPHVGWYRLRDAAVAGLAACGIAVRRAKSNRSHETG